MPAEEKKIREFVSISEKICAAKIVKAYGSSPRGKGAFVLVNDKGSVFGTIGGGSLEKYVQECSVKKIRLGMDAYAEHIDLGGSDVAMVCGGSVDVEYRVFNADDIESIIQFIHSKKYPSVYIFGAGHVAGEVCFQLEHIGFDITVLDNRPDFVRSMKNRFPTVKCLHCDYSKIENTIKISEGSYVAVMTHGHEFDSTVLLQLCRLNLPYIGCIGSRSKVAFMHSFLQNGGIDEKTIQSVHSPIGLEIGGDTPEEIGISVAAEIIKTFYSLQK